MMKIPNVTKEIWEKICINHMTDKELEYVIYKEYLQLKMKKTNTPILNMDK